MPLIGLAHNDQSNPNTDGVMLIDDGENVLSRPSADMEVNMLRKET